MSLVVGHHQHGSISKTVVFTTFHRVLFGLVGICANGELPLRNQVSHIGLSHAIVRNVHSRDHPVLALREYALPLFNDLLFPPADRLHARFEQEFLFNLVSHVCGATCEDCRCKVLWIASGRFERCLSQIPLLCQCCRTGDDRKSKGCQANRELGFHLKISKTCFDRVMSGFYGKCGVCPRRSGSFSGRSTADDRVRFGGPSTPVRGEFLDSSAEWFDSTICKH